MWKMEGRCEEEYTRKTQQQTENSKNPENTLRYKEGQGKLENNKAQITRTLKKMVTFLSVGALHLHASGEFTTENYSF